MDVKNDKNFLPSRSDWEAYFDYLDELRNEGITNMYGAVPFVVEEFRLSENVSRKILYTWMDYYSPNAVHQRVDKLMKDMAKK